MGALEGKVALITGAASGIGNATAARFASEGAKLCLVDINDDGASDIAKQSNGIFIRADVSNSEENASAFDHCVADLGGLDVAFLNAGIALGAVDVASVTDEDYARIVGVNLNGVFFGLRSAALAMRNGGGGAIVATSSIAGLIPFAPDPIYTATKHAVVGLARAAAITQRPWNITVNTVNPGLTDTGILSEDIKTFFKTAKFPIMEADEIADAVLKIVLDGRTGQSWVCQPGRDPEPFAFQGVPGPRGEGEGVLPPGVWDGLWPE